MMIRFLMTLIAATLPAGSAAGEVIRFRLNGTIEGIEFPVGELPPGIFEGAPFEAELSYDLATPDGLTDDPLRGHYDMTNMDRANNYLRMQFGESVILSRGLSLWVGNDIVDLQQIWELPGDMFAMRGSQFDANFDVNLFTSMQFFWNDPTGAVFDTDVLPTSLDISAFEGATIWIQNIALDPRVPQFRFNARVESIEPVPEPNAFEILAGAGLSIVAIVLTRRARIVRSFVRSDTFVFVNPFSLKERCNVVENHVPNQQRVFPEASN